MKKQLLLSLVLCAAAGVASAGTKEMNYVKQRSQEISYAEQQQANVWPGFHPAATPTVFIFGEDSETHNAVAYALNFTPKKLAWEKAGFSNAYYLPNAEVLNFYNFENNTPGFQTIDGSNSYTSVLFQDYIESENIGLSFMHDRAKDFITDEAGLNKDKMDAALDPDYDGFADLETIKLIYLEDAALTQSLSDDPIKAEKALRDAIAIHLYRQKFQNNESANRFENAVEIIAGTPVYIALQSKQLNANDFSSMSQRTGCMPLTVMLSKEGILQCVLQGYPTLAGAAYAHALDARMPQMTWKTHLISEFKSASNMLSDYYHFNNTQIRTMTTAARKNPAYHYARIEKIVDAIMKDYLVDAKNAKQQYQQSPGVEFRMAAEEGLAVLQDQYGDQPRAAKVYQMSLSTYLYQDINIAQDNEHHKTFVVENLPFMVFHLGMKDGSLEPEATGSYTGFKLDETAEIVIDGVRYTAAQLRNEKKVINFQYMDINDSHVHYEHNYIGKLDASDGILTLTTPTNGK